MNASKQHNYSGQTAVYDRVIQLSDSAIDVKSLITDTKSAREIAVNNFLSTYDLVADGENMILSGATIRAKIINKSTGEEVLGIAKPTEFIWYDDENNIIANGIDKYTFEATKFIGKLEKKFRIVWNHIIEYSIGDTLHEANIEYVVNFTLRVLEITQYIWTNCLTEQELEEQGYKQSGLWSDTISENPQNYLYLWVRKSNNNRLTWVYYRSTGEQGQKGENGVSAKNININSTRHYFDRAEKNSSGGKGAYVDNQIAVLSLNYTNIDDTEQVEWYFNGSLRFTLAINQTININYTFLENNDTLTISVKYNGQEYDSIQIITNIIKSTYAGVLPSSDISPVVINGREVIDGDHFIYINSDGEPIVRLFTDGEWKDITGNDSAYYSEVMSDVLYDVIKQQEVISSLNGTYNFFKQLATFSAFIENLYAKNINVENGLLKFLVGIFNNTFTFDLIQNGKSIFSVNPSNGKIFLGTSDSDKQNPVNGFMVNPSTNELSSKDGMFKIDTNGKLYSYQMKAQKSEINEGTITNANIQNCVLGGRLDTDVLRVVQNGTNNIFISNTYDISFWAKGTRAYYIDNGVKEKNIAYIETTSGIYKTRTYEVIDIYLWDGSKIVYEDICKMKVMTTYSTDGSSPQTAYVFFYDKYMNIKKLSDYGKTKQWNGSTNPTNLAFDLMTVGGTSDPFGESYGYVDYKDAGSFSVYMKKINDKLFLAAPLIDGNLHTTDEIETNQVYIDSSGNVKVKLT